MATSFAILDDMLVREELVSTCGDNITICKRTAVITKEEFIACYKAWIGSEEENGNTNQDT